MFSTQILRFERLIPSLILAMILAMAALLPGFGYAQSENASVSLTVDLNAPLAPLDPVWAWVGYDEPNYTYMKNGQKLLTELAQANRGPVYVRAHNLLTSGDGTPALKWGSTNVYTEDENGNPIYDWTLIDRIFDAYVERGMKPLVEIGFMPKALSSNPKPYKHNWSPSAEYSEIFTGWAYPPSDYEKWAELIYQWVRHSIERYGKEEVETWLWEPWNEPNIGYWRGTTEEYLKLYDYTVDAVRRALPTAKVGGPHSTGPSWDRAEQFLRTFLEHCLNGENYATGESGSPLDFIAFHAKGSPDLVRGGVVRMDLGKQLRDISAGFEVVASYPELKDLPVIIGESDPEGCAACSTDDHPQNAYRNGTMYSSYTAAAFARKFQLADHFDVNFEGAVTWAFQFENQPWFAGFRALATNGVDKPVLSVFRMFGMMRGDRVKVSGDAAYDYVTVRDKSVRGERPDISALASSAERSAAVIVWNYHDLNVPAPPSTVKTRIQGFAPERVFLRHYRIDQTHSNAYTLWREMGEPQNPTPEQYAALEQAGQLQLLTSPEWITPKDGAVSIEMELPRQGVSLLHFSW